MIETRHDRPHERRARPAAPTHEFLVASFFAPPSQAIVEHVPAARRAHPRAEAMRRKLLVGDFP
jgi:hypothetical protein